MRVLGLDLSLTSTGVALHDGTTKRLTTRWTGMDRLAFLRDWIITDADRSDLVVIEGYSFNSRSSQAHALGELGGIIRLALHEHEIPWCDVAPATLKKFATGKGNASKEEMLVAAVKRLGYDGSSNDEADALWLRAAGLDAYGLPVVDMPKAQRDALAKVDWPALDPALGGVA